MSLRKRQKVQSKCGLCGSTKSPAPGIFGSCTLDTLPPEVLEMILQFLTFQEISSTIRLVSRRCYAVAASILNTAFIVSGAKLEVLIRNIKSRIKNTLLINRFGFEATLNVLQVVRVQYNMLKAVTWRYTHPKTQQQFSELCFYAGSLLDDLNSLLHNATTNPPSYIAQECQVFIVASKRFMDFFEKVSERKINRSALVSGCKIVDILDCLLEGRQLLSHKVSYNRGTKPNTVTMRLKYTIKRAWFTSFEVSHPKLDCKDSWRDQQRFMYQRLRRLVGSINEHFLADSYYEQTKLFFSTLTQSEALTYSGYGECGGQFFYYGHMNKYAYDNKFKRVEGTDLANGDAETEETRNTPSYDLTFNIRLKCSWDLAPLAIRDILKSDEMGTTLKKTGHQELFFKLNVHCLASVANRLPANFKWDLHSPQYKSF